MGIRARNFDIAGANRYVDISTAGVMVALTGASANTALGVWGFGQRSPQFGGTAIQSQYQFSKIVDVVLAQTAAGVGGTSYTINIQKNGTTIWTTTPVYALASGSNVVMDTKGELSVPGSATRGVLKTDSTVILKKGDNLTYVLTVTGTYTTGAQLAIAVIIDPFPV